LKGSPRKGNTIQGNGRLTIEGYTDAKYVGSLADRRSTTGYYTFLGENLVTRRSKKQNRMWWQDHPLNQNSGPWHKGYVSYYG